ncbi:MAG: pyruvate kinase [Sedimentisphaerales bacterium]|jgi:pyruvate kinase
MTKTKIVATLGPACIDAVTMRAMLDSGVNVFRLNFSHGTLEHHAESLDILKKVRTGYEDTTAIMGDLCGPKVRMGRIEPDGEMLLGGDTVVIVHGDETGNAHRFCTNYKGFVSDVKPGHRVFIDDGRISLEVTGFGNNEVLCKVIVGGPLYSNKGINLPDTDVSVSAITEQDWKCVDWAIENELDFLALSFVRGAGEVAELKQYLTKAGSNIKVIAKIEKPQAVNGLREIVEVSDGILVARGDLGVEMDLAEVPLIQKHTTEMCKHMGKPVIVATQMLQSMIENPVATRAEISDVANAIMDCCDAVMLSGETAVGKYPLEAVKTIGRIAHVTEAYLDKHSERHPRTATSEELRVTESISRSVGYVVDDISPKLVVVWSESGGAARLLSKARIDVPILALSSGQKVCRQMCLDYGVMPCCLPIPKTVDEFVRVTDELLVSRGLAKANDKVVLVAGQPLGEPGRTNTLVVHVVTGR